MKAEHRKELETNVLADRMGRFVQRMKTRPKRRVMFYVIVGLAVLIGLYIFIRVRNAAAQERSEHWVMLEDGFKPYIDLLATDDPDTNPGKAARFQRAWMFTWSQGLQLLAIEPDRALVNLQLVEGLYLGLAKQVAGDPIWEPEALYSLAVIAETKAVRQKDRSEHLDQARDLYRQLAKKYKDSAHGKMAEKRAELLDKNRQQIVSFYDDLQTRLKIPEEPLEPKLKKTRP